MNEWLIAGGGNSIERDRKSLVEGRAIDSGFVVLKNIFYKKIDFHCME